tara:strand:- start:165 stop:836 length:672 start_codon:yes stop_codon:yes gene_type:complete
MMTIGIENGTKKGFTTEELKLTNGFELGVLCMHVGVGKIEDKREDGGWHRSPPISAEEARDRFMLGMDALKGFSDELREFLSDIENIKRMQASGWSNNCGSMPQEEFMHHMRNMVWTYTMEKKKYSTLNNSLRSVSWEDKQKQEMLIRQVIGFRLAGNEEHYYESPSEFTEQLIYAFDAYTPHHAHSEDEGYHFTNYGQTELFLRYNDDTCEYELTTEKGDDE